MTRDFRLYFGRELEFIDKAGETHPNAFWKLDDFHINTNRREMVIVFVAWHSKEEFDSGAESLANVGGRREYVFSGEAYSRLIEKYAQAVAGVAIATHGIADSVKDTPGQTADFQSFFAGAGQILLPE
jgi:hypothetical protein